MTLEGLVMTETNREAAAENQLSQGFCALFGPTVATVIGPDHCGKPRQARFSGAELR